MILTLRCGRCGMVFDAPCVTTPCPHCKGQSK